MADKSDNPFQFWQELKRRKVIRVIPVYAAASFVLLELVDIIAEPLRLPDWTINLVLVLLGIGFIISIILSWVYDITPEGVKKTESAKVAKQKETSPEPVKRKLRVGDVIIAVLVVVVVILAYPKIFKKDKIADQEKSIAVLPFINDSPDNENMYFINGIMEEILNNLQKISDLRVISRTSVEQYRGPDKPTIPDIVKELNVNFIVEGSGQKYGNKYRIRVQLLNASNEESHLWGESYEQEIKETEDIFTVQSQIAQSIAAELQAVITPEEKQLIEKIPTTNLTAHDYYLKGIQAYYDYWQKADLGLVQESIGYFRKSLEHDPDYSLAYTGLGRAYWMLGHYAPNRSSYHWEESIRLFKKAISLDPGNGWAYSELGLVQNNWVWDSTASRKSFEKALELAPNRQDVYDHYVHLESRLGNCSKLTSLLKEIGQRFNPGDPKVDISLGYFNLKLLACKGEFEKIAEIADILWDENTNVLQTGYIVDAYIVTEDYKKALEVTEYMIEQFDDYSYGMSLNGRSYKGTILAFKGDREHAEKIIDYFLSFSESRPVSPINIASIYLALGDKDNSQAYLEKALQQRDFLIHEINHISPFYLHRNDTWLKEIIHQSWVPLTEPKTESQSTL